MLNTLQAVKLLLQNWITVVTEQTVDILVITNNYMRTEILEVPY